jgi:hypothetical protein
MWCCRPRRCFIRGVTYTASYGDPIEFETYFSFNPSTLRHIPISSDLAAFAEGNPVLTIPKAVLFEPADSSRQGLLYFSLLPSGNCYSNDVELHLAVWNKSQKYYLGVYRLRSVTSHGRCAVFVDTEDISEFLRHYKASITYLNSHPGLERDYVFAAKSDAFKNIEEAKTIIISHNPNELIGTISSDAEYTRCMKRTLADVIKHVY